MSPISNFEHIKIALSPPSWIQKIIDNILINMRITIKNFIIYYENKSILGYESVLKLRFEEFDLVSTDSNWNQKFHSNNNIHYKILSMSKLSLSLTMDSSKPPKNEFLKTQKSDLFSKSVGLGKSIIKKNFQQGANDGDNIYKILRSKESFLLNPIDFHSNIKMINHILTQELAVQVLNKITLY